ncbi:DUF3710 domain-containing protein [Arsenicicoccus sp. oral taxon 190]|uniref:DUF3710 domain-containing protein n=1 Tax=Arsenicicoccus sp. oral taxon 190 TaxID=1658671 RepID=UPI00067C65FE|nr:DUF3710 domain-containing protein [Arsenicicoccus sp. oral taxon 190]
MAFFRRDKSRGTSDEGEPQVEEAPVREEGPYDRSEVTDVSDRLDLGSLLVPGVDGMEMRLELDQSSGEVVAVSCHLAGSVLQLQGFAAPRTLGIWDDIRDEIAASIEASGGTAELRDGRFGTELAVQMATGPGQLAPARFVGVDGPRWFLRGFLSGPAVSDEAAAATLLQVFAHVVVVRGDQAMAPRELLPLRLPEVAEHEHAHEHDGHHNDGHQHHHDQPDHDQPDHDQPDHDQPDHDQQGGPGRARSTDDLQPFERGPEITETR